MSLEWQPSGDKKNGLNPYVKSRIPDKKKFEHKRGEEKLFEQMRFRLSWLKDIKV